MALASVSDGRQVVNIGVDLIMPNPYQPRKRFNIVQLQELADSIKEDNGHLIQPILVRPNQDRYELVAGERRLRACKLAGFETIEAIVREDLTAEEARELTLIENLQREDLTPIEEAHSLAGLVDQYGGNYTHVASRVGKSEAHVRLRIAFLTLSDDVQEMLEDGRLNLGQASAITEIEGEEKQREVARRTIQLRLTPSQIKGSTQSTKKHSAGGSTTTLSRLNAGMTQMFDDLEGFDYGNLQDQKKRAILGDRLVLLRNKLTEVLMAQFGG